MTKIDESKQYKFSEIIAMLENEELPKETNVSSGTKNFTVLKSLLGAFGLASEKDADNVRTDITSTDINSYWSIKLPKEDKFYLKAPKLFARGLYLNYNKQTHAYFLGSLTQTEGHQTKFTQKEIDTLPFDTTFFEKVKVEDE